MHRSWIKTYGVLNFSTLKEIVNWKLIIIQITLNWFSIYYKSYCLGIISNLDLVKSLIWSIFETIETDFLISTIPRSTWLSEEVFLTGVIKPHFAHRQCHRSRTETESSGNFETVHFSLPPHKKTRTIRIVILGRHFDRKRRNFRRLRWTRSQSWISVDGIRRYYR